MLNLKNKRVMVVGAKSMIGRAICEALRVEGANVFEISHELCELTDYNETCRLFESVNPQFVFHAAGYNGGIKFNRDYPEEIFRKTSMIAMNVLSCCVRYKVEKVLSIISSCAYPDNGQETLKEEDLWNGSPNPSVECHGFSKRLLNAYSRQIHRQPDCDTKAVCVALTNCYGPYDRFDEERGKVVSGLVRKFCEAKKNNLPSVECWGTGKPLREFMFSEDAGRAIVEAFKIYDNEEIPLNIGTGHEISIKELVNLVVDIVGYEGEVIWNVEKGDGQMRKLLDSSRMRELMPHFNTTTFRRGLEHTVKWYKENYE